MNKKIKKFLKSNIKVLVALIIGMALAGTGVYAATVIASNQISYDNTSSKLTSTNLQDAIDEVYDNAMNKSHCPTNGTAVTFKVGDYVKMTPSSTSFQTSTTYTGYTSSQTINPSELNLWRVIRINADNTVDMVSEYVSSVNVYFSGQTGYQNYVGYLNKIAHQYENSCYTVESRHMGYNGQTEYITDTTALTSTTAPQKSSTSSSNVTPATEAKGLGDMGFEKDYNLVNTACGTRVAYKVGTSTATAYWLASRNYIYVSSTGWSFSARLIGTSGSLSRYGLYIYDGGGFGTNNFREAIRPIVTLKSGVKASSGNGSSSTPYVLG